MLYFIKKGFSPSLNEIKGRFVELEIFKNLLKNLQFNEVVVSADNRDFYKIMADSQKRIVIEPMKLV